MINLQEVRSGNIFHDKISKKDVVLTFRITHYVAGTLTLNTLKGIVELEPILITEEWLDKFGFEKTSNKNIFTKALFNFVLWGAGEFNEFYINETTVVRMKYVHELQNLYFALRREDLIVKAPESFSKN